MTYGPRNIVGVLKVHGGKEAPKGLVFDYSHWPQYLRTLYDYVLGCHLSHALDMSAAIVCYFLFYPNIIAEAKEWNVNWVSKIVGYNLACEVMFYGFWHWITYAGETARGNFKKHKFNPENQYEKKGKVGFVSSTSGHLQREVFLTTCGWLQSSAFQCVMTWLWATGRVPYYVDFWSSPLYSVGMLLLVTYWRELHFYWVHRAMHPWFNRKYGLAEGDVGAFLYRWVHSWHHKSYNPGPFSGLSMHPVEHLIYYTCTLLPLIFVSHPLHFLYAKFHADIAPIGGHDGFGDPAGNSDYHYLHHAKFECNYGVPFPIDFDRMFGTWVDFEDLKKAGGSLAEVRAQKQKQQNNKKAA